MGHLTVTGATRAAVAHGAAGRALLGIAPF
jgi:hypothetical protein